VSEHGRSEALAPQREQRGGCAISHAPTWLAVHHAPGLTLATRQWLIPPEQVGALADCTALAAELATLREREQSRIEAAERNAQAHGFERGRAEGREQARAVAAQALAERLLAHAAAEAAERQQLQAALVPLALLVVRRVAGTLAPPEVLTALVRQAVQQVLDPLQRTDSDGPARCVVRLHPTLLGPVRERLGDDAARFSCTPDATLAPLDVVIETPSARVLAGLETQLQRVQAALATWPREALVVAEGAAA
jgi:type III secretion protein L